jgi:hypothetical protein
MEKILIASIDSDIGVAIHRYYAEHRPDVIVETTSRNGTGKYHLELAHPMTWPFFGEATYDKIYYTIGTGDVKPSRMEVMQVNAFLTCDFLTARASKAIKPGGKVIVMSSGWGSIGLLRSAKAPAYRMSKAALNMGVAIAANRFLTNQWILMHPGFVNTKMTRARLPADAITPEVSAAGVVTQAEAYMKQFGFIDYEGNEVPF